MQTPRCTLLYRSLVLAVFAVMVLTAVSHAAPIGAFGGFDHYTGAFGQQTDGWVAGASLSAGVADVAVAGAAHPVAARRHAVHRRRVVPRLAHEDRPALLGADRSERVAGVRPLPGQRRRSLRRRDGGGVDADRGRPHRARERIVRDRRAGSGGAPGRGRSRLAGGAASRALGRGRRHAQQRRRVGSARSVAAADRPRRPATTSPEPRSSASASCFPDRSA